MTIPSPRVALTQLVARLDQTIDKPGPVPAWMDSYCTAVQALKAEPKGEGPVLQWTDNMPPCEACRYDHCTAETPFGRFLITWRSWKDDCPTVDETPWGYWYEAFDSVDDAKAACQKEMNERLARWGIPATPPAPAPKPSFEALAVRPLLEQVAAMADCIGAQTVDEITAISSRAAAWLRENPPGQPVAIEPRGCPTPGACSCVEPAPPAPEPGEGPSDELMEQWKQAAFAEYRSGGEPTWRTSALLAFAWARQQQAAERAALRGVAVSERPWEREEWCDEQGRCWLGSVGSRNNDPGWVYRKPHEILHQTISLPHNAIPLPAPQAGEAGS